MKERAIKILTDLQKSNPYIESVYLWGSITTDEYMEGKSDIDAIAFVNESAEVSEKDKMNKQLDKELHGLKINFLYPSELNGGPSKSGLTKHVHSAVIMYDFPAWIYVCGKKFTKEDFEVGRVLVEQVAEISLKGMKERFLPIPEEKDYIYFVKALAKFLYFLNQNRLPFKAFRCRDLVDDSSSENIEISKIIVELKASGWDSDLLKSKMPALVTFLDGTQ